MLAQSDIEQGLRDAWADVASFVPKFLGFLLILLIGWFVAKLLSRLTDSLLERVGFDGWVQRGTVKTAFERSNTDASDLVGVVVFWGVFLIALQLAFGIWGPNPISDLLEGLIAYLPNVVAAIVILVIAGALAKLVTDVLSAALGSAPAGRWIARGAGIAIMVIAVFAALNQLRIAPAIVTGLFYALLVVVAGSLVIAFGVGGIPVAREYLQRWSGRAEATASQVKASADPDAARARTEQMRARAEEGMRREPGAA